MSVFLDVLHLLTSSPGAMVYYLVLLFSVWSIVGLALSRWSRGERDQAVPRILLAGALLSFIRFIPIIVALLDRLNGEYLVLLGPPLERFVDTLSVILISWAFVMSYRQRTLGAAYGGMAALVSVALYVVAATQWADLYQSEPFTAFNLTWHRWAWELWQLALLCISLVYLLLVPVRERGTLLVSLSILAVGHLLQAVFPLAEEFPYFASWVRFANLLAFPMFGVVTYQLMVQRFEAQAADLQSVNQESLSQITGLMALLDTNRRMSISLELDTVLDNAVRGLSQALQSTVCAIALAPRDEQGEPDLSEELELSTVYSALQVTQGSSRFGVKEYPPIQYALSRNKPVVLNVDDPRSFGEKGQVSRIYVLLGAQQSGPLIVQPLEYNATMLGVLLVGRPGRLGPFTSAEARKCQTLASHIALTIVNALKYERAVRRIRRLRADFQRLETEHVRVKTDLENQLRQRSEEVTLYIQRLYETELNETRAQNDAREARRKLVSIKEENQSEISDAREELQRSIEQVARLKSQLAQVDASRLELAERVNALEQERDELHFQLAVAATAQGTVGLGMPGSAQFLEGPAHPLDHSDSVVLELMGSGLILCDQEGRITRANRAAAALLDVDAEDLVGQSAVQLFAEPTWQPAVHTVTDEHPTVSPPSENKNSTQFVFIENRNRSIQAELAPIYIDQRHIGATITLHDARQADERIRARDEFLASLAQDLRTPMTSILGYTELLMNESVGKLAGIQRKFLQRVQANVERMRGMLNDLIGITAIDSGRLMIEREPVDIVSVIETALRKVQFRLEEKQLSAQLDIDDLPVVFADPECVQQIVDNLLTNACKSSENGSTVGVEAHIETEDSGQAHLHVAVSDTGGGIAPEDRSRVFERFYRADNALIAGLGETGVGLALVKSLVEAHKGHVWHESEMGVGTTFHFTLPLGLEQEKNGAQLPANEVETQVGGNGGG